MYYLYLKKRNGDLIYYDNSIDYEEIIEAKTLYNKLSPQLKFVVLKRIK